MANFVGRTNELKTLNSLFIKQSASLVVIKGRRRIGKSRLVEEFAKNKKFIRFSGIPPTDNVTDQSERDVFAKQLGTQFGLPGLTATDWADLFTLLSKQALEGRVIILFDEISWMASRDATFLGKLKNAWDLEFSKNPQLILILCGSVSTWIQQNIISSTAFFGRISLYINLEELPLKDCNNFLEIQGFKGSVYEKFKIFSTIGGIPWYLEHIQPKLNADENIKNLCFRSTGILFNEFDLIFYDLFGKKGEIYKKIIELLAKGTLEFNEICRQLNYSKSGVLSEYLDDLIEAAFITRDFTWIIKTGKESRLSHFRLSDNYLRFYLKYIVRNKNKILTHGFENISMATFPEWDTIMGLQFENLILRNRIKIKEFLGIKAEDIVADNPFFQRKTLKQAGCQIDYLIQTRFNVLFICEIKFSKREIKSNVIKEVQEKVDRMILPKGFACCPVLIHVNGVEETVIEKRYFREIIDFSELL
ncbi:AAA family ATPase [Rickettsia endosymbiont of Orchestes rusci]|uniref:AAA family ATPase n=1 Tax=Rickettsia endosymbiont of Orchestes rusci TaxID=3066250 RepID=UPI00313DC2F8